MLRWIILNCILGVFATGCSDATGTAPVQTDPSQIYARMVLNHRAVVLGTMKPYDTLQLRAIPYAADGSLLVTSATPTFVLSDSGSVRITPDGLLIRRENATSGTADVVVSLSINNVTRTDTIPVAISSATPLPKVASAMIVRPTDSTKRATGFVTVQTEVLDSSGTKVTGIPVRLWIEDTTRIKFERARSRLSFNGTRIGASGGLLGKTWLYAATTVFGREFRDSLEWTVGNNITAIFYFVNNVTNTAIISQTQTNATIGVGGVVKWNFSSPDTLLDIVFDDPTMAYRDPASADSIGGNVPPFRGGLTTSGFIPTPIFRTRKFSRPGIVRYQSVAHHISGTITIVDERPCMPNCPPFPAPSP